MAKGLRNRIIKKAFKNKALTDMEIQLNKIVSKTRYKIERTFVGMVLERQGMWAWKNKFATSY